MNLGAGIMAHGDIVHVEIPVGDFAAATTLYDELFGWKIGEDPEFPGYPMWRTPSMLAGGALVGRDAATQPLTYVEVDSIDDTLAKAIAGGGSVIAPKGAIAETSWYAVFADPDGNLLGLFEGTM